MIWASIDVGIKNCSICVFSSESKSQYEILYWENIDLTNTIVRKCQGVQKKGSPCKSKATLILEDTSYCKLHAKQLNLPIMTKDLKSPSLNKKTIGEIKDLSSSLNLNNELKKKEQIANIVNYVNNVYYKPITNIKVNEFSLVDLGKNIVEKFDHLLTIIGKPIDLVIIENQIGPLAIKMKTLQGMITQYFIMRNNQINIEWISSSNKLKEFSDKDNTASYKNRKKLSIEICQHLLENHVYWKDILLNHKKKDDLADSFLQGIWYLRNKLYMSS